MISHIELENPTALFELHFNDVNNKRILFSGEFGCGKTYFLKNFFKTRENKFNTFWLSPVKYAVGHNEDIVEYIKINIAYQLLKRPEISSIVQEKFSEDQYIYEYIRNKPLEIVKLLIACISSLNITTGPTDKLLDLLNSYNEYSNKLKENLKTDTQILIDYIETSLKVKGSIFEDDFISQTIRTALNICKKEERENILIIDDFDRLDPDHIFRILNILSVHNDYFESDNKFDFDKILIICDYNNIKKIFHYKYGPDVDFYGYINKFFSNDIFHFTNENAISLYCETQLTNVINFSNEPCRKVLGIILAIFVKHKVLTMRQIVKQNVAISFNQFDIGPFHIEDPQYPGVSINGYLKTGSIKFNSDDFPFLQIIKSLTIIFGSFQNLLDGIERIKGYRQSLDRQQCLYIIQAILPLYHLSSNYTTPSNLAFKKLSLNGFVGYPSVIISGNDMKVPVIWDEKKPYNGVGSFFYGINYNLSQWKMKDIENDSNYETLFIELKTILTYLQSNKLLNKLGIS